MSAQIITSKSFHLKYLFFTLGFLFSAGLVHAAATSKKGAEEIPWYQIEVIIFANKSQIGLNSELWPEDIKAKSYAETRGLRYADEIPDTELPAWSPPEPAPRPPTMAKPAVAKPLKPGTIANAVPQELPVLEPVKPPAPPVYPYIFLNEDQLNLNNVADEIARSPRYSIILHIGWRQPTVEPKQASAVYVYEGMTEKLPKTADTSFANSRMSSDPNAMQNLMITEVTPGPGSGLPYVDPIAETHEGPIYPRLTGTLRLGVSRYLHLETDLHMRLPFLVKQEVIPTRAPGSETESSGFGSFFGVNQQPLEPVMQEHVALTDFRLAESRRLRSSEIHYFDNPMFSVIVQVVPYDPNPNAEEQPTR